MSNSYRINNYLQIGSNEATSFLLNNSRLLNTSSDASTRTLASTRRSQSRLPDAQNQHPMRGMIILSIITSLRKGPRAVQPHQLLLSNKSGSSTGAVLFDNAVHAGPVRDVCHWVAAEIPDAAVTWLFIKPMRTAVPGMISQSWHAAMR